jgi:hypothetical protein
VTGNPAGSGRAGRTRLASDHRRATLPTMADDEKILKFPGAAKRVEAAPTKSVVKGDAPAVGPDGLNEDQRKAMQIVLSGMPFVLVGIKATPSGADFFTAVSGEPADLRNSQDHLGGVIERAFSRKGI